MISEYYLIVYLILFSLESLVSKLKAWETNLQEAITIECPNTDRQYTSKNAAV